MLQQIVVGIDGSEGSYGALKQSILLAKKVTCCIKSVFVVDRRKTRIPYMYSDRNIDEAFERSYITPDKSVRSFYSRLEDDIRSYAERCLVTCNALVKEEELSPVSVVKDGYPASELREEALSGGLLAVGRRGEDADYLRSFLGSTAEDLIRSSPRPVLLVPAEPREVQTVVFMYDGSRTAESSLQFFVNTMAELPDRFILLTVDEGDELKHRIEEESEYARNHGIEVEWIQRSGHVDSAVEDIVKESNADLLLIGAKGKNTLKDYFIGSTTSKLVHQTDIPVLIV